ncbi:DNA-binding domain of Mlu1-box binding protein MBP1 [Aulographum hederae CBS 113979]|uniref:DNA-binding domain of Mlu1-box binding protein MBP1 n=1 Tax=Aulographum hederae CBS 113979 TaxID=1176131 RepID=A0A6G1HCM5_9PEZI|nr:DNA-binding domain of Mlu1-box binding protein MBP1 [Aulographum hederae CBS 113979]
MVQKRTLPDAHNPLLEPEHTPVLEILVERRRLGQTDLAVRPGQQGLTSATKPENLGIFDYAHLRAPLPKDLKGSGIFSLQKNQSYPESYFLMRRSSDGFISATGMFKAAFPWASAEQETAERKHHKSLPTAGSEEVAGNVWISPEHALTLAEEYHMRPWIVALLDPEPIEKGTKDKDKGDIATPPKFIVPNNGELLVPMAGTASTRKRRDLRSASPAKLNPPTTGTPGRKIASPRKPRATKGKAAAAAAAAKAESVASASSAMQDAIDMENGTPAPTDPETEVTPTREKLDGETVRVSVDEEVQQNGDVETTHTTVSVEMPTNHADLPLPESTEQMIETARKMVEQARENNGASGSRSLKRKADDIEDEDDEGESSQVVQVKKLKTAESVARRETVRTRATVGLLAAVAIGSVFYSFF